MEKTSWYVYILRCKDKSLYIGVTNNIPKRVSVHNLGKGSKYVRSRLPALLVFKEKCTDESEAKKREAALKKLSKESKEKLTLKGLKAK